MIIHTSIPSARPEVTARLIADLIDGDALPFRPVPGAWVAVPRDGSGANVEVYPLGTVARPGTGSPDPSVKTPPFVTKPWEVQLAHEPGQSMASAHHLALATRKTKEDVLRLGTELGYRAVACERGGLFEVVELWIENEFLLEVVTEPELERYHALMKPEVLKEAFAKR